MSEKSDLNNLTVYRERHVVRMNESTACGESRQLLLPISDGVLAGSDSHQQQRRHSRRSVQYDRGKNGIVYMKVTMWTRMKLTK